MDYYRNFWDGWQTAWMNTVWRYAPSSNTWAWLGGTSSWYPYGNYGTLRQFSSSSEPGGRVRSGAAVHPTTGRLW